MEYDLRRYSKRRQHFGQKINSVTAVGTEKHFRFHSCQLLLAGSAPQPPAPTYASCHLLVQSSQRFPERIPTTVSSPALAQIPESRQGPRDRIRGPCHISQCPGPGARGLCPRARGPGPGASTPGPQAQGPVAGPQGPRRRASGFAGICARRLSPTSSQNPPPHRIRTHGPRARGPPPQRRKSLLPQRHGACQSGMWRQRHPTGTQGPGGSQDTCGEV